MFFRLLRGGDIFNFMELFFQTRNYGVYFIDLRRGSCLYIININKVFGNSNVFNGLNENFFVIKSFYSCNNFRQHTLR